LTCDYDILTQCAQLFIVLCAIKKLFSAKLKLRGFDSTATLYHNKLKNSYN